MKKFQLNNSPIYNYAQLLCVRISKETENQIDTLISSNKTFFVLFDRGLDIICINERNARLVSFVNERRYKGVTLFVNRGNVEKVTKENWSKIYKMVSPKRERIADDRVLREKRQAHEIMFEECSEISRYHKPSKKGFFRTQAAHDTLHHIQGVTNIKIERI